ncbi:MAG TPA: aminotransferase class I/II-fold pyridoxal phosphate-dependent enzyme [Planctomycetaceae bacterium]
MIDALLADPLWRPEDLGRPIPDSPHAVSVCLPTWRDTVGYEEGEERVRSRLRTGYPRFVYNPLCRELFDVVERRFARDGEACRVFPSPDAADRCARYLRDRMGHPARVDALGLHGAYVVTFPRAASAAADAVWQHGGEGISSRHAEACLTNGPAADGTAAERAVRERLADLAGVGAEDVFLFSCGMSAFFALHRAVARLFPGRPTVQFGFPYVDALKVQQKFGAGARFFPRGDAEDLARLDRLLDREPVAGLFTEFPSNPLLVSPDLERLSASAHRHGVPLVVDDTLAGFANADLLSVADAVCTSLTKFFSGVGDVTAGSVVVNPRGPFAGDLAAGLRRAGAFLWGDDAVVLERNSRDYLGRAADINRNAEALAEFLVGHPAVAAVHYPKSRARGLYDAFRRRGGGYGGLLSFELHDAPRAASRTFDALRVCKGPNLGTGYTLVCPYTLLAHYGELEFAESCGVSRHLIRVSVGTEPTDELIRRFDAALASR